MFSIQIDRVYVVEECAKRFNEISAVPEFRFPADKIQSRSLNRIVLSILPKIAARNAPRNGSWKGKGAQIFRCIEIAISDTCPDFA